MIQSRSIILITMLENSTKFCNVRDERDQIRSGAKSLVMFIKFDIGISLTVVKFAVESK